MKTKGRSEVHEGVRMGEGGTCSLVKNDNTASRMHTHLVSEVLKKQC